MVTDPYVLKRAKALHEMDWLEGTQDTPWDELSKEDREWYIDCAMAEDDDWMNVQQQVTYQ